MGGACCFKLTSSYTVATQFHPSPSVSTGFLKKKPSTGQESASATEGGGDGTVEPSTAHRLYALSRDFPWLPRRWLRTAVGMKAGGKIPALQAGLMGS